MIETGKKVLSAILLAASAGCVQFDARFPENARLKTGEGPLVQAHRGSRHEYDDNAAGGFAWCLARGVRGFEADFRFTKDRHIIAMHDDTVDRTTDGTGVTETLTLAQIRALRLDVSGEQVPTAQEVFDVFKGRDDFFFEIEMKAYPSTFYTPEVLEDYCRQLNAAAKARLAPGTYAFTCFNVTTLETMRRVAPDAPLGLITGSALAEKHLATARRLNCCSVAPSAKLTTREMVARAHQEGLSVTLWMAQSKKDWETMKEKGADRVTSDYPVRILGDIFGCSEKGND